ncbi:MAG: tetratricopeptide repeat protein, partial [Proteobacteria bacterium]|nr:tetratricopeptide repeat protein [Pseudomonadota bacterium]
MYARGVRCGNCHDPHSGSLIADGNAVCTQCHNVDGNPAFPSLRNAAYDALSHHHHQSGSAGAQCISCHMPERLYMVVDGRRDHSFRIPRADLTDRIGTPNACTDCHTEKSAGWAATNVESWHPDGRSGTPHYGEVFAAARDGLDQQTQRRLLTLAGSDEFAGIVRATALDLLRPANASDVADAAAVHLGDSDAIVRAAAANLQRSATPEKRVARLARLLSDPKRSVRIEAARNLLGLPVEQYQPQAAASLKGAIREYQRSLSAKADFPESQLAIAGTALVLRNWPVAEQAFTEAVTLDPQLVDGWLMISRLQNQHGDATLALDTLQRSIVATPDNGVLRHALASQLSAVGRFESAIRQLDEAVLLLPDDPIVLADLGVLKFHLNQYHDAVQTLERAQAAGARSPEILYALTMSLLAIDDRDSAKVLALKLELLYPDSPLAEQIRQLID